MCFRAIRPQNKTKMVGKKLIIFHGTGAGGNNFLKIIFPLLNFSHLCLHGLHTSGNTHAGYFKI